MKIFNILLRSTLFVAFAFMGSSLSCDLFDKVDDVTFPIEISHTFVIDENLESVGSVVYFDYGIIDPNQNDEFVEYKDKITDLTITSVTYTVTNYDPSTPGVLFSNGVGSFSATADGANAIGDADLAFQNIQASQGTEYTLNYSTSELQEIATRLKDLSPVFFVVTGTFSSTPVAFNVPVVLHCTITADAL